MTDVMAEFGHAALTVDRAPRPLAGALFLSPGTVRNHLSSAMQKLDARNRAEAVRFAEQKGWL
jgi:DNA-binding CsgD family transcriptional regulator